MLSVVSGSNLQGRRRCVGLRRQPLQLWLQKVVQHRTTTESNVEHSLFTHAIARATRLAYESSSTGEKDYP